MTLKKKPAFGGSIVMIIGVFMPIGPILIVGSMDYFRNEIKKMQFVKSIRNSL